MIFRENITDPELLNLASRILEDTGFDIQQYKERPLKRRLAVRMRACRLSDYREYAAYLKNHPEEYSKLFDALTINVTKFYRNPETYQAVAEKVLPEILREHHNRRPLLFWSAGCSSGEEPYSLAIMWLEFCQKSGVALPASVVATDIDRLSLERAQEGVYDWGSLDEMPRDLVPKYFLPEGKRYRVTPEVRRLVSFRRAELMEPSPFLGVDMIFCRNVLIYFQRTSQAQVFQQFQKSLRPGGFLVLGKVETMLGSAKESFLCYDTKERIYRLAG